METLNKNWLLILLIAIIFGTLGFLVGRVTGHHHGGRHHKNKSQERVIIDQKIGSDSVNVTVELDDNNSPENFTKIDTIVKDGKKIIVKEVQVKKVN